MDTEDMIYIYIFHCVYIYTQRNITWPWKEWNNAICSYMDGTRDYHTMWSKLDRERQVSHNITYMWNLKKKKDIIELIYKAEIDP